MKRTIAMAQTVPRTLPAQTTTAENGSKPGVKGSTSRAQSETSNGKLGISSA